jgi:hypothetical protein
MNLQLVTQNEPDQLMLEGYTNVNAFSFPDGLESWSPTEDKFLKYVDDPPALIACVAYSHTALEMVNLLFQCDGGHRKR